MPSATNLVKSPRTHGWGGHRPEKENALLWFCSMSNFLLSMHVCTQIRAVLHLVQEASFPGGGHQYRDSKLVNMLIKRDCCVLSCRWDSCVNLTLRERAERMSALEDGEEGMAIMMISSQQTWLAAEDLCEIKSLSVSVMCEGENQKFPPNWWQLG